MSRGGEGFKRMFENIFSINGCFTMIIFYIGVLFVVGGVGILLGVLK